MILLFTGKTTGIASRRTLLTFPSNFVIKTPHYNWNWIRAVACARLDDRTTYWERGENLIPFFMTQLVNVDFCDFSKNDEISFHRWKRITCVILCFYFVYMNPNCCRSSTSFNESEFHVGGQKLRRKKSWMNSAICDGGMLTRSELLSHFVFWPRGWHTRRIVKASRKWKLRFTDHIKHQFNHILGTVHSLENMIFLYLCLERVNLIIVWIIVLDVIRQFLFFHLAVVGQIEVVSSLVNQERRRQLSEKGKGHTRERKKRGSSWSCHAMLSHTRHIMSGVRKKIVSIFNEI